LSGQLEASDQFGSGQSKNNAADEPKSEIKNDHQSKRPDPKKQVKRDLGDTNA